ncbi:MAG: flagellar export chaperone FliS [Planctomycetota bacterium]|nr:flagellar export chaperone FliS [Planctomycetota bacterium]
MNPQAANYLRVKVLTATPEQLQLMLFDGALRFGQQARAALEKKNYEQSFNLISQTQKIVNELQCGLRHDVAPELCGKLASLYNYAYRKLTEATIEHRLEAMDEALEVLKYQRETWVMLLDKLAKQKAGLAAQSIDIPTPDPRMEATFSAQG